MYAAMLLLLSDVEELALGRLKSEVQLKYELLCTFYDFDLRNYTLPACSPPLITISEPVVYRDASERR